MYSLRFFLISAAVLTVAAAVYDYRSHRIPNWLTSAGIFGGVVGHAALAYSTHGADFALRAAELSLLGMAVVGLLPMLLWMMGAIGGGDVKIILAIGAVCHASLGMTMVFTALSLMTCFVVVKLAWDGNFFKSTLSGLSALANPFRAKEKRVDLAPSAREPVRFGPALAVSAIALVVVHGGL